MAVFRLRFLLAAIISLNIPRSGWFIRFLPVESSVVPNEVCSLMLLCGNILHDLLDVLTSLSDCRQEPVEKMERRISGVSCMYWMDFYDEIFVVDFYVFD